MDRGYKFVSALGVFMFIAIVILVFIQKMHPCTEEKQMRLLEASRFWKSTGQGRLRICRLKRLASGSGLHLTARPAC